MKTQSPGFRRHRNPPVQELQAEQKPFFSADQRKSPGVQTKGGAFFQSRLTIGKANDAFEQEADAAADKVVTNKPAVQKVEAEKEEAEKPTVQKAELPEKKEDNPAVQKQDAPDKEQNQVQTKSQAGGSVASPEVTARIEEKRKQANPQPDATRAEMERELGRDFSDVSIHTDTASAELNEELNAQAFTNGKDIFFNAGKFNPSSKEGRHLLAHELTHVVQQNQKSVPPKENL